MKLVSAKCPSCGAALKLAKEDEKVKCEYCQQTIIVDDAIACYKLKISGMVSVDGITTNAKLIEAANELLDMSEYLKAKRKFQEFSEKCPDDYQGWLGLLICRTRNFTIKDKNIMFENDINKYYEHFLKTAPKDIKNEYSTIVEDYLHPKVEKDKISANEDLEKAKENIRKIKESFRGKGSLALWVIGWIFCFPIPLTILIWRSNWSKNIKISAIVALWLFVFILAIIYGDDNSATNTTSKESPEPTSVEKTN